VLRFTWSHLVAASVVWSLALVHVSVVVVVRSHLLIKSWLNKVKKLRQDSEEFWLLHEHLLDISVRFLIVLEVSLVVHLFLLNLSHLFDLVVVDVDLFSVEGLQVQFSLCFGGLLWGLEAYESIDSLALLLEEFDTFDRSVLTEEFMELLFGCVGWEVLHVQVASLL